MTRDILSFVGHTSCGVQKEGHPLKVELDAGIRTRFLEVLEADDTPRSYDIGDDPDSDRFRESRHFIVFIADNTNSMQ